MQWRALPWIVGAGFVLRVVCALPADNLHHPDEVFQVIEQAHRWVFGYGLVPWEFQFGTRSWLLPAVLAVPLQMTTWLGVDHPNVYLPAIKILFCAISVCVIPLVYVAGRRLASETAGRVAAITAALWYELVYFSFRPLPDVLAAYLLLGAFVVMLVPASRRQAALCGALLTLAVALRLQLLPVAGVLGLVALVRWTLPARIAGMTAAAGVVLAVGLFDRVTWGAWFVSYAHNYLFNVVYDVSALFGLMGHRWYADQLVMASCGLFAIAGLVSLRWWRQVWLVVCVIGVVVASHTAIGHKEYRFVFAAIPFVIILFGVVIARVTEGLSPRAGLLSRRAALVGIVLISIAGGMHRLPGQGGVYDAGPLFAADPSVVAFRSLTDDPTLKALYIADDIWPSSLGYAYLHRDIPIYFARDLAAMRAESGLGVESYASHVIHRGPPVDTPGFSEVSRFGPVEIRRNNSDGPLRTLNAYSRRIPQPGVDGVYTPSVSPFLPTPK
jgi:phosphatidylinositol glycan class B